MTYEDFKKSLNTFFKPYGFRRHSTHFHCEASDGVMVVFGVRHGFVLHGIWICIQRDM